MATIKTAISLKDDVHKFGVGKASRLFGGNFSAYINFLVSQDRERKEEPIQKKDNRMLSAIEQIMDL